MTDAISRPSPRLRLPRWSLRSGGVGESKPDIPEHEAVAVSRTPPLGPRLQIVRAALIMVFVLTFTLLLQMLVIGSLQQSASQERSFDSFRADLARGTAPIGPADDQNRALRPGTPVAYIEIPAIGLRQVIAEGTTPSIMFGGPGHRRDTPLPGQIGTSVVFGRNAAFGGPFSRIDELDDGDTITVTTGQGVFEFNVLGIREEGDPVPTLPEAGQSRLTLATAGGQAFLPDGVIRVDADLDGDAVVGPPRAITTAQLPRSERLMAGDTSTLWALALWLQALILLALGATWAWHRWGRAQTWVVFLPPLILVGLAASGEVARVLPNMT